MTDHAEVQPYALVAAIRTKLDAITDSVATANLTMQEGISDPRVIQVYLAEFEGSHNSRTSMNTMGSGLQLNRYTVRVDVYSRSRSQLGEDISAAELDCYSVIAILEAQTGSPAFGLSGVHTFHWSGKLGVFPYAASSYWGSQFTLEFMCH